MAQVDAERLIAGRYRLTRYVREGAGGAIWEAEDRASPARSIDVALLASPSGGWGRDGPGGMPDPVQAVIGRLRWPWFSDPGVVRLLGYGTDDGVRFAVMERVNGETLQHRLRREIRLPPPEAALIAGSVAKTLQRAHSLGVAHGDLRPETVMLSGVGVKVLDLGLTPAAWDAWFEGADTEGHDDREPEPYPGRHLPESARAADIRSIGALLFEMLSGRPHQSLSVASGATTASVLRAAPLLVPERLARICAQALAEDPLVRPPTAGLLGSALLGMGSTGNLDPVDEVMIATSSDLAPTVPTVTLPENGSEPIISLTPNGDAASHDPDPPPASPRPVATSDHPGQPKGDQGLRALAVAVVALILVAAVSATLVVRNRSSSPGPSARSSVPAAAVSPAGGRVASPSAPVPRTIPVSSPSPKGASRGAGPQVPPVEGMTVADAARALDEVGLVLTGIVPALGTPGRVLGSVPDAGTTVEPGSDVVLFVGVEPGRLTSLQPSG